MANLSPELRTLKRLISAHDTEKPALVELDAYYAGKQPLAYMHPELVRELDGRIKQVVVNWPRLIIDSVEERLDVEGFRYPGADKADAELLRIWQFNNLDEWSQQGHVDGMVMRRFYTVVSHNDKDENTPLISVESPLDMHAELDPATRTIRNAIKRWKQLDEESGETVEMATLYLLTGYRIEFTKQDGEWEQSADPVDTKFGEPPVTVLPNRPRLLKPLGTSDLDDVTPLSDAACKIATDMMVAAEFHAVAQRWVFGMGPEEFKDPATGQPLSSWQAVLGRVWANKNKDVTAGQFEPADLKNFHDTLNALARMTASMGGLPIHELGFVTENPPSADAIRAGEIRRIKRAERKQRANGGGWERTMRLARRAQLGDWDENAWGLETIWRDPSTPTIAQKADAAVKLYSQEIVPLRQTREDLGYTPGTITRMEEEDAKADPMARITTPPGPPAPPAPPGPAAPPAA